MDIKALIVDLTQSDQTATLQDQLAKAELPLTYSFVTSVSDAKDIMSLATVAPIAIIANDTSSELGELLRCYQSSFGPMSDFQAIVCSDPSPLFMASVFEFGVEQFVALETWIEELQVLCRSVNEKLSDEGSPEYKTMQLAAAVRSSDAEKIKLAKDAMGDLATYDFRAAYASGKASEASGNYDEAMDAYRSAGGMNKLFRPTSTSLGEACLITGRADEAIAIFEKLDRSNPSDLDRKSSLAAAYIEKGDLETAQKYAAQAESIDPSSSRLIEIKAQVLLSQGKVNEAFVLIDKMSNVGPYFAAKLNDLGIKLSQAGKGKSALALYQKAHKVVREDLRYKISLNAALACRRLEDYDMALKYVARCAKEYGSLFPKLAKIRETLTKEKANFVPSGANASNVADKVG